MPRHGTPLDRIRALAFDPHARRLSDHQRSLLVRLVETHDAAAAGQMIFESDLGALRDELLAALFGDHRRRDFDNVIRMIPSYRLVAQDIPSMARSSPESLSGTPNTRIFMRSYAAEACDLRHAAGHDPKAMSA